MKDQIVYVILVVAFCVIPAVVIGVIVLTIRYLNKPTQTTKAGTKTAVTRAAPASSRAGQKPAPVSKAAAAAPAISTGASGDYTPLYLNFSNKPRAITENMNALAAQAEKVNATKARWRKGPRILFWLGLGLIAIEGFIYLLGYTPSCAFLTGGIVLWVIGIVLSVSLRRAQMKAFPPTFNEFEQIINTLRDDLRPGTGFIGNLDLTGARQTSKVAREANDARGRTTQYFRDQWLNFKAKLYDGNILRVSGIQRLKERKGFTARGKISGKTKWKPAKFKGSYQELKVRIAVNPDVYTIARNSEIKHNNQVGEYTINAVDTEGGIVTVLASSPKENVSAESVLGVLKFAYGLLKLKKA
jgi:hypothetical protein